jgi:hypothetical protein
MGGAAGWRNGSAVSIALIARMPAPDAHRYTIRSERIVDGRMIVT